MFEKKFALPPDPFLKVNYKKARNQLFWAIAWVASVVAFSLIQLIWGADEVVILLAAFSLLIFPIPVFLFGIDDISSIFVLLLLSKYSFFPLWIKTFLGQRIDVGLHAPATTFLIALLGSVVACVALFLAKMLPVRRRILGFSLSNWQMLLVGYLGAGIGAFFLTLHVVFSSVILPSGEMTQGFGGFGSFISPLYLGVVCLTAVSLKPGANPVHRASLVLVILWVALISLRTTAKVYFTFSILAVVFTIFYYSIKIKLRYYLLFGLLSLFYIFVFAPVLHLTRTNAFLLADFQGKMSIIGDLFEKNSVFELLDQSNDIYNLSYYPLAGTFLIDRFEMVKDLDIPAAGITASNTIGWTPLRWAFETSLPRIIFPNKPQISDIDLIAYNAGYFPILRRLNHTIGIFGSAYAMFLWPSMILVSLFVLFAYILMLRVLVIPSLRQNIFGIFLLATYGFNFSEQSVQSLASTMLRSIPLDVVLIFGILFLITLPVSKSTKKVFQNSKSEIGA